jgi:hypothetical protein
MEDGLPRNGTSARLEAAHVALGGEGRVFGFTVYNSNATDQFILVFDRSTIPSNGATPDLIFAVGAKDNLLINWIPGRWFRSGCVLCNSSTDSTLTAGSADCLFDVQYA